MSSEIVERLIETGASALVLALIIGAFGVAGVIDMPAAITMLAFAWVIGTAAMVASDFFREPRRRWPIIGMAAASIVLAAGLSAVGLYIDLRHPQMPLVQAPTKPPQEVVTHGDKGSLHRNYAPGDRNRLSELLFAMCNHINDNISPLQLEIHRISTAPTPQTLKRLGELRDKLNAARIRLEDLSQSNGYYQDEIADVLGNWGQLSVDIAAITNYIDLVSAVSPDPQDRATKIITPAIQAMHEANGNLGTWVSECITRIKAKRNALQ